MKNQKYCTIKVAILADEPLGWKSGKQYFRIILDGYSWTGENNSYTIQTFFLSDKEIRQDKLIKGSFDVLLIPGGGVGDGHCIMKGLSFIPGVKKWKKNIKRFVERGGGCIGICGGAALVTDLITDDCNEKFLETLYDRSSLHISTVKSYYSTLSFPIFYPKQKIFPEKVGAMAYVFSFKPGETEDGRRIFTAGVPVDFTIDRSHPFFTGYDKKTVRMRWWGGPALITAENNNHLVKSIAAYPQKDFSQQKKTKIYAWKYTGGIFGIIKSLRKALSYIKKYQVSVKELGSLIFYFAGDWKKTNKPVTLNFQDKSAIVLETYPNEKKARIFLCTSHPEYMIWEDGHINEIDDQLFNCIAQGFHQWRSIKNFSKDGIKELTSTWWIVRRAVAWTAKIPDDDYPPIDNDMNNSSKVKVLAKQLFWNGSLKDQIDDI